MWQKGAGKSHQTHGRTVRRFRTVAEEIAAVDGSVVKIKDLLATDISESYRGVLEQQLVTKARMREALAARM